MHLLGGGGVFCKVEGVHFAKWRGCILQSGGGLKVVGVYFIFYRVSGSRFKGPNYHLMHICSF